MTTNAQAALQAAATQFSTTASNISPNTVMGVAAQYKRWLERQDLSDQEASRRSMETSITGQFSRGGVNPPEPCPVWQCTLPKGHPGTTHPPVPLPQVFQRSS